MKRKLSFLFMLMVFSLSVNYILFSQNLYIEVIDAETYRPLSEVTVELLSDVARINLVSSPRGEVSENVPAGVYNLTLQRPGYIKEERANILIRQHELTTLSVSLHRATEEIKEPLPGDKPEETDKERLKTETTDEPGQVAPSLPGTQFGRWHIYQRPARKGFVDLGYQIGNIQLIQLKIGYFAYQYFYSNIGIGFSRQDYSSAYFIDTSIDYPVNFFNVSLGIGYDFPIPLTETAGVFVCPAIGIGLEAVHNNSLINNDEINYLLNSLLKPELRAGAYYNRLSVFLGVSYSLWLSPAFNENRNVLQNGFTRESLSWSDDLFLKRKGIGFNLGIAIDF